MKKDGARSLPSQSLIEGPCFRRYIRIAHKLQLGQLLGRYKNIPGLIAYFTASSLDLSYLSLKSYSNSYRLSDLSFQCTYLVIQKRPLSSRRIFGPLVLFTHLQVYHGSFSTHPLFFDCNPQGRTISLIHFISPRLSPVFIQVPDSFGVSTSKLTLFLFFFFFTGRIALHLASLLS
jgi:hypothetical protein